MDWFKRLLGVKAPSPSPAAAPSPSAPSAPKPVAGSDAAATADLKRRMASLYRPALQLRPARTPGFMQLGGLPTLPPDVAWPEWKGKPLAFLAQLDLAVLHHALPSFLPASGQLYFFYDQGQGAWGFDPKDEGAWRVLYFPGDRARFAPRPAPVGLAEECVYQPRPVVPHRIDLLPSMERLNLEEFDWKRDDDAYFTLREEAFGGLAHHQALGFPTPVQDDAMELQCQLAANGLYVGTPEGYEDPRAAALRDGAADWSLLLQLDSDDDIGWMWGDVGTLYFWVREADARRGDFTHAWMVMQCS